MKKIVSIIIACFLFTPIFGQLDRSVMPKAGPAPEINIPDPIIFKLENGITVILSENHKTPRFSANLVMGSDPTLEKDKAGLADIAGQLILSGTSSMNKDELDKAIDMMGVQFSADGNSVFASGLSKHKQKMLEILTQVVRTANFPQSEFDRIIKQSESALTMTKSDPKRIASNVLSTVNFGRNHPYGEVMTDASLTNITRDDVISYFKQTFTPNGAYLVVVGDVTKAEITKLLDVTIAKWTGGAKHTATYAVSNENQGTRVIFVKKPGAVQSVINVTFPLNIKPGDEDQIALTLMNRILGGGTFEAKLMQNLREDKAYTYGCYSAVDVDRYGSYFTTKGSFRNEVTDSAIVQILKEIKSMKSDTGVNQSQLDLAIASTMGSFSRALERPQTIARFALNTIQNNLGKDYYKNYLKALEQVTLVDIQNMAKKYLAVDKAFIVVVGSEDVAKKLAKFDADGKIEFLDAFGNKEVGFEKATIALDQLLNKYIMATTQTSTMKDAEKVISKIKTLKQVLDAKPSGAPVTLNIATYFEAPSSSAMVMSMNGNMMQKQFFNGKTGGSVASMMMGGKTTELSPEEVAEKIKTAGVLPEMNYLKNDVKAVLLGMKEIDGKNCYVVEIKNDKGLTRTFYNATTFMKVKEFSSSKTDDGKTQTVTVTYADYKAVSGVLFPHTLVQQVGPMTLNAKVSNIEVNKKIDQSVFEK